jgi:transposase
VLRCVGEQTICLFFTGRQHAGENLDDLLALRDGALAPMLWMSDALAANTPKRHGERVVDLNCLVHARRQFVDIKDFFPSQCEHVITAIAMVYHQEAQCTKAALSPTQRLAAHQAHSAPVMDALKGWMEQQFADKQVEPNSRLGQALNYMLKRWQALTGFVRIPGAPLDNNLVSVSTIIDVVSCTIFDRCAGMIRPSLPAGRGNEDEPQAPQGERGDQRRWRMARWMV